MAPRSKAVGPLIVWTLLVWSSRIRNIWADDGLTTAGQVLRTGFAVVFLGFAVAMARCLWIRRGQDLRAGDLALLSAFIVWTIGFWLVRGIGIILDDHTAGFTLVHTALMVASIVIALLAGRILGRRPLPSISSSSVGAR